MAYHANVLSDNDKIEIVKLYSGTPKISLSKLSSMFKVGVQQITDVLDESNVNRKKNKKREAKGWKPNQIKPKTYELTKATDEYTEYIFTTMAEAGRMGGDPVANYEMLSKQNPFKGVKRTTITKHRL